MIELESDRLHKILDLIRNRRVDRDGDWFHAIDVGARKAEMAELVRLGYCDIAKPPHSGAYAYKLIGENR